MKNYAFDLLFTGMQSGIFVVTSNYDALPDLRLEGML